MDTTHTRRMVTTSFLTAYLDAMLTNGGVAAEHRENLRKAVDTTREAHNLPPLALKPSRHWPPIVRVGDHDAEQVAYDAELLAVREAMR